MAYFVLGLQRIVVVEPTAATVIAAVVASATVIAATAAAVIRTTQELIGTNNSQNLAEQPNVAPTLAITTSQETGYIGSFIYTNVLTFKNKQYFYARPFIISLFPNLLHNVSPLGRKYISKKSQKLC